MATSRSGSDSGWTAGAFVFSGRRDPTWALPPPVADQLVAIWESLPSTEAAETPPALGYRGCYVRDPDGRTWTAYRELVTLEGERRRDDDRRFEGTLLGSAPDGILPPFTAEG